MDWDSIRQFILEDREIKEYFLLLAGGENPLQAECDRREPFYGIPSPGAAYTVMIFPLQVLPHAVLRLLTPGAGQ